MRQTIMTKSENMITHAVIITDCTDISFVEMHQSLYNQLDEYGIHHVHIAPLVSVKNFSVIHTAFSIRLLADIFPPTKTIFIVVVHGIATNPARIFGQTSDGLTFIGNNSGYFNWLIKDFGLKYIYENKINRTLDGRSFGGKYVQIPTAAKIIANIPHDEIGNKREESFLSDYDIPDGTVVHIDNFGLIKIKAPQLSSLNPGDSVQIFVNGSPSVHALYSEKMKREQDGKWVLFAGSSLYGLPELGRVRSDDSAKELSIKIGDIITWKKI